MSPSQEKTSRIALIDANAVIHRAYHALPPLTSPAGELTNAVYGFTLTLLNVMKELQPTHIAAAFDLAGPTFRDRLYEPYKSTREKAPQELYDQIPRVKELLQAFSVPILEQEEYEADDIIGSMAEALKKKMEVVIVTGDRDALQLIEDNRVTVFALSRGIKEAVRYNEARLLEEYQLTPAQFIDYKALAGDASDNIPGVPGIGEKTATALLTTYGDLDNIYETIAQGSGLKAQSTILKGRILENLVTYKDQAYLSRKLATIVRTLPLSFDRTRARVTSYDRGRVLSLFRELGFHSLVGRLPKVSVPETEQEKTAASQKQELPLPEAPLKVTKGSSRYETIDTAGKFQDFLSRLTKTQAFAFDTETASLDTLGKHLTGLSFSWEAGRAFYLPFGHVRGGNLSWGYLGRLKPIFEERAYKKIGHNQKFDGQVLASYGITARGLWFDTMIAAYLLAPGQRRTSLADLAFQELGQEKEPITDLIGKGANERSMAEVEIPRASAYASRDADLTWQLYEKLSKALERERLHNVFHDIEMPLVPVLITMERNGVALDTDFLSEMSVRLGRELTRLEEKIYKLAKGPFNVNSPRQLSQVLFERLGLPKGGIKRTTQGISTRAEMLAKLEGVHPIIEVLLSYRELSKLKSTYLDALPKLVRKDTGRIHTDYSQVTAATGRLASSEPNLQNIPVRTELGKEIRKAFVAPSGLRLLAADYSQIELRILASLSGDPAMEEEFRKGNDIHVATAARIFAVEPSAVDSRMRRVAKTINFGIIYGMSPYGLAEALDIPEAEAASFIGRYFNQYRVVKEYLENLIAIAKKQGYVETLFGRRRYLPELGSSNFAIRAQGERMTVNLPFQGTNADIMKKAMVAVDELLTSLGSPARMVLTVHDELILEIPEKEVAALAPRIKEVMERVVQLSVPLVVNLTVGKNWGKMFPYGKH
ncbi:MAG: DNA polymerase I [Parcubacteria group bacterium]|nr:DNA polymerase I [Parcubacteria group bacterium]